MIPVLLPLRSTRAPGLGGLRHRPKPASGRPATANRRSGGSARHQRASRNPCDAQERRGVCARGHAGHPGRDSMARPSGVRRAGTPLLEGRHLRRNIDSYKRPMVTVQRALDLDRTATGPGLTFVDDIAARQQSTRSKRKPPSMRLRTTCSMTRVAPARPMTWPLDATMRLRA